MHEGSLKTSRPETEMAPGVSNGSILAPGVASLILQRAYRQFQTISSWLLWSNTTNKMWCFLNSWFECNAIEWTSVRSVSTYLNATKPNSATIYHCWLQVSPIDARDETTVQTQVEAGRSVRKKAKTVPSTGKVMVTISWDSQSVMLIY